MHQPNKFAFLLGSLLLANMISPLQAATYTWNGLNCKEDLNTATNWLVGGVAPRESSRIW